MPDFTLKTYARLIEAIQNQNYTFQTFKNFIENPEGKSIVMRHDVDRLPKNALRMAELEANLGVKSSYYFRSVKESFDEEIIRKIAGMGHEMGYHYESLSAVARSKDFRKSEARNSKFETKEELHSLGDRKQKKGSGIWDLGFGKKKIGRSPAAGSLPPDYNRELYNLAIEDFEKNLEKFREIVPIKTICMHGSPTSKYDSRDLWKVYDYHDYGVIGEPYFDIDFSKVLYLTDTGRCWDGGRYNIRDRVINNEMGTGNRRQKKGSGIWDLGFGKRDLKSETRISKSETSTNAQNTNDRNKINLSKFPIEDLVVENKIPQTGNRRQKKGSGIWDMGSGKQELKSEILSTKSETNPNDQNPNDSNKRLEIKKKRRGGPGVRSDLTTENREPESSISSVRTPATGNSQPVLTHSYKSSFDIINALEKGLLPNQIMINTHPQRWTDNYLPWVKELVWQNMKNQVKRMKKRWGQATGDRGPQRD